MAEKVGATNIILEMSKVQNEINMKISVQE